MILGWVGPQHKQASVCRDFAQEQGVLLPKDSLYLVDFRRDGMIMGMSAMSSDPVDPYILYMYVPEAQRRHGIGSNMMGEIVRTSSAAGITSLRCLTEPDMGVDSFLEKHGFSFFPGPTVYKTTVGALRYSEQYLEHIDGKPCGNACTISAAGKNDREILKAFITRNGLTWKAGYDDGISVAETDGEKVNALILCDRVPNGIVIKYLYSKDGKANSLLRCFRALNGLKNTVEGITPGFTVSFALEGDRNYRLIRILLGDDIQISEPTNTTLAVKLL